MACEMDLCCSESCSDLSADIYTPERTLDAEPSLLLEYSNIPRSVAAEELERLLQLEEQAHTSVQAQLRPVQPCRERVVDAICVVGARLNFTFTTISLAVSLLDRFTAASAQACPWVVMMAALACLSVAGKLEEVFRPPSNAQKLSAMFPSGPCHSDDLTRMELTVLSVLGWKTLRITAANLLEPLISLLDLDQADFEDGLQLGCIICEGSKIVLARALRGGAEKVTGADSDICRFRPSTVALSAIQCLLEELCHPTDVEELTRTLRNRFSGPPPQKAEVQECCKRMWPLVQSAAIRSTFRDYRFEVDPAAAVVRMLRVGPGSGSPTSVLHDSLAYGEPFEGLAPPSSYAEWQLKSQRSEAGWTAGNDDFL